MPQLVVTARVPDRDPADVWELISAFERYPEVCPAVLRVDVEHLDGDRARSTWQVEFRDGQMEWTEEDHFDRQQRTIRFEQTTGDFEQFAGSWAVRQHDSGSMVEFAADFDLGIPSLGLLLDHIAERSLRENVVLILRSLLGERVEIDADAA